MAKSIDDGASQDELMQMVAEASEKNRAKAEENKENKVNEDGKENKENNSENKETENKANKEEGVKEYDWKSLGDGFNSFEDVKTKIPKTFQELEALRKSKADWEKKEADYTSEINKLKKSSIDDPDLARLNKLKKDNPDDYQLYARVKLVGDVDPIDLLKAKLIKGSPSLKDDPSAVDLFIKSQYGLDVTVPPKLSGDDYTPEEIAQRDKEIADAEKKIQLGKVKLKVDSDSYRNELTSKFDGIELPEPEKQKTEEEIKEEMEKRKTAWTPVIGKLTENFEEISIPGRNEKGETFEILRFPVPKDKAGVYGEEAIKSMVDMNLPYENDSIKWAANFLMSKAEMEFKPDIYYKVMEHGRNMADEEWEKLAHNVTDVDEKENREGEKKKTKKEEGLSEAMRQLNM